MDEISYKEYSNLTYRKDRMRDLLDGLSRQMDGWNFSFRTRMVDEDGVYSEARTQKFIDELMEALQGFMRVRWAELVAEIGDDEDDWLFHYYQMSQEELQCYRSFLYCALRNSFANYSNELVSTLHPPYTQTLNDLAEMVGYSKVYDSYPAMLKYWYFGTAYHPELHNPHDFDPDDFNEPISYFVELYDRLCHSGKKGSLNFMLAADREMDELRAGLTEDERSYLQACKEWDEDWEVFAAEADGLSTEAERTERRRWEEYDRKFAARFTHFTTYEKHLRTYLHLQHLRRSSTTFRENIIGMIDFYLASKGRSYYADQRLFYRTVALLRRFMRQAADDFDKREG